MAECVIVNIASTGIANRSHGEGMHYFNRSSPHWWLYILFLSTNIFVSLIGTSKVAFVEAGLLRNRSPQHATKGAPLTFKEITKGEVDGLDIQKQYELDRAHPPKPESTKDKNGLPYYNQQSLYIDGFSKTKKLVEAAAKMFPNYHLSPNRILDTPISKTPSMSSMSKFAEDPGVYGMRGAKRMGGAPDVGLKPMDFPITDPNGGPSLLYQQYSTHQYDQKLTDVSDPKENARILRSSVIQDPIKQRHFNVEQMSGKTFLQGGPP